MTDEREERLEATARHYDQAAEDLRACGRPCHVAAEHFRRRRDSRRLRARLGRPRHMLAARDALDARAREHRLRSRAD